jgi:hypothetical protein
MPGRDELVVRAEAVGIDTTGYANDSVLEQEVIYQEKALLDNNDTENRAGAAISGGAHISNDSTESR